MTHIRVREAAAHIGLSKSTLDKMRHFGTGPQYYKLGRAVIYKTSDLDAWIADRAATSTWQTANDNRQALSRSA